MIRWCLTLAGLGLIASNASAICWVVPPLTFRQQAKEAGARIILSGTFSNPRLEGDAKSTDFYIETTLRSDAILKGRTSLVLPVYISVEKKNYPPRHVLFCDVENGKIDAYKGVAVQRAASVDYVKKAIALDTADPVRNILFFFQYLDDPDPEVAKDAFIELSSAEDADIGAAGRKVDAKKIRRWLRDPKLPATRTLLYAKLLAASGTAKDGKILRAMLDDRTRESDAVPDSILVAYTMLAPKDGWAYTLAILSNPGENIYRRLGAARALRHIAEARTGVVSNRQITAAYRLFLAQDDLADIAIDDLRRSKRWDLADAVLAVARTDAYKSPLVQRFILRYALQCEGNAAATAYVAARRKADPEAVADAQEVIDLEAAAAKKCADITKK